MELSLRLIDVENMTKISVVESLADKAYHAIRGLIVSLELAPGALIDERELIERLEIGRTPVREALRRLAQERLVEVYPRRGMFVTAVDADRAGIDELIAELDAGPTGDRELMALDERIHRAVYEAAHNDLLEATL